MVLADGQGVGAALAEKLSLQGDVPILVYRAAENKTVDERTYHLEPGSAEGYRDLMRRVASAGALHGVVHLWSLDAPEPSSAELGFASGLGCGTALLLVQALLQTGIQPAGLWLITRDAQAAAAGDKVSGVGQSGLWGMGKVIALEHPELHCIRVDLCAKQSSPAAATELWAELTAATDSEDQVALREGQRLVARLARLNANAPSRPELAVPAQATYLITGGLGGLGLEVADWLAQRGARHLLLVGRSDPTADTQARIEQWKARGVDVIVARADVTDRAQLAAALGRIDSGCPLRGVIYSVGVLDDGTLLQQSPERFARVMGPKVQGAWNVHALTQEASLDFFVVFASAAGLLGSPGQANHAAANAFLDAFASYRRAEGKPGLSIDWGAWSEVGAAAELVRTSQAALAARGQGVISTQSGLLALAHLMTQDVAQAAVMPIDWPRFLRAVPEAAPLLEPFVQLVAAAAPPAAPVAVSLRKELIESAPAARTRRLVAHIQQKAAAILGMAQPPATHIGLTDLGLDSLMAVELRKALQASLELSLPSTIVFEHPTIDALCQFLLPLIAPPESTSAEPAVSEDRGEHAPAGDGKADVGALSADELMAQVLERFQAL